MAVIKSRGISVIFLCSTTVVLVGGVCLFRSADKPIHNSQISEKCETAVFAGGCFWGLQAAFDELPGVVSSRVGYTGGTAVEPTYSKVVVGTTGHAEAVEVTFDPDETSFAELVQFHLEHVRPSKRSMDTNYSKKHYRQSIFVKSADQRITAKSVLARFNQTAADSESKHVLIEDSAVFWEAEAEHQNYLAKCVY